MEVLVERFKAYLRSTPIICAGISAVLMIVGVALIRYSYERLGLLFWAFSMMSLAATLYSVRRADRRIYGVVECVFGFLFCFALLLVAKYGPPAEEFTFQMLGARIVALMTGIYVVVRALDNVGEGLTPDAKWAQRWDAAFPKAKPKST